MLSTLYIPRVNRTHMGHADYMKKVFEHQGIAMVKSVEFFEHEIPSAAFGFAIVKILFWIPGPISKHFQQRLKDASKETRIVFSDPSYWIVLPYTEKQKQQAVVKIPFPTFSANANVSATAETAGLLLTASKTTFDSTTHHLVLVSTLTKSILLHITPRK